MHGCHGTATAFSRCPQKGFTACLWPPGSNCHLWPQRFYTTGLLGRPGPVCKISQAHSSIMLSYGLDVICRGQATIHHINYFCWLPCLDFSSHICSTIECDLSSPWPAWTSVPRTLQMLYQSCCEHFLTFSDFSKDWREVAWKPRIPLHLHSLLVQVANHHTSLGQFLGGYAIPLVSYFPYLYQADTAQRPS